jgi:hypothetical protein
MRTLNGVVSIVLTVMGLVSAWHNEYDKAAYQIAIALLARDVWLRGSKPVAAP